MWGAQTVIQSSGRVPDEWAMVDEGRMAPQESTEEVFSLKPLTSLQRPVDFVLKLTVRQYSAMHTNHMLYNCTTLQYNHDIRHGSYAEAKF